MMKGGIFARVAAYAVLALGFWLLFQAFEKFTIIMLNHRCFTMHDLIRVNYFTPKRNPYCLVP